MGQYLFVNLTKKAFIDPARFGEGSMFCEWADPDRKGRALRALAMLLGDGYGFSGGDPRTDGPLLGAWSGDRLAIAGSQAASGTIALGSASVAPSSLYDLARQEYADISSSALALLEEHERDLCQATIASRESSPRTPRSS
jgi:hypothetical protein